VLLYNIGGLRGPRSVAIVNCEQQGGALLKTRLVLLIFAVCTFLAAHGTFAQQAASPSIPVVDGELGPCSVEFTVTDGNGNPIGDASVRLHLAYGFMGVRRLDLEAATNSEGKARFTGLPEKIKKGLFFRASKDDREGAAYYDPAKNCNGRHTIVLARRLPTPEQSTPEQAAPQQ
jgi:hypothetical protein